MTKDGEVIAALYFPDADSDKRALELLISFYANITACTKLLFIEPCNNS